MARFYANNGRAHKLGKDIIPFRLRTRSRCQDTQRSAVAHPASIPSRCRRAAPLWEGGLQRGEPLSARVRTNGIVHRYDGPSKLDGENLIRKHAICQRLRDIFFSYVNLRVANVLRTKEKERNARPLLRACER